LKGQEKVGDLDVDKKFEELVDVSLLRSGIVPPHPRSYLDTVERGLPPSTRGFDRIARFTPNGDPPQITEPRGYGRVPPIQLPTPPESKPVKGILRKPREKFPEDPDPIREGVVPPKDVRKDGIPPNAIWTKINRKLVSPAALEEGKERYEAREDFVIVLRVLAREEIQAYMDATKRIRGLCSLTFWLCLQW
jgi:hypothetical protein